jgi:hypothetical protein
MPPHFPRYPLILALPRNLLIFFIFILLFVHYSCGKFMAMTLVQTLKITIVKNNNSTFFRNKIHFVWFEI